MKVLAQLNLKNITNSFWRKSVINKISLRYQSESIEKSKVEQDNKQTINDEEASREFYFETIDLENNNSLDIFEEIKKKENLNAPKIKNEDKYEKVSNLKAYQNSNNKLIIEAINRNRDIKRTISDKTDCSDDNFIGFGEGVWDNNIEKASTPSDYEEMDDNKIEELINYVKHTSIEDIGKFRTKEIDDMTNKEYKNYIMDVLRFLQLNINKNYINKANKNMNDNLLKKEIDAGLEKKFNNDSRRIDKYFLEKQNSKRIIFGKKKEMKEEEYEEIIEYLNEESRIDFKNVNADDPDIINKHIPQTQKDRKKFKQIIDIKSEVILV